MSNKGFDNALWLRLRMPEDDPKVNGTLASRTKRTEFMANVWQVGDRVATKLLDCMISTYSVRVVVLLA